MVDSRGLRSVSIRMTPDEHRRLKILAAKQERTIRELFVQWLQEAEKRQAEREQSHK